MTDAPIRRYGGRGPFNLPYSRIVTAGGFVFISGQIGVDGNGEVVEGGVEPETLRAIERIVEALSSVSCCLQDLVKITAYIADAGDFPGFNKAYGSVFRDAAPARITVAAPLVVNARVELDAIAYRPHPAL